MHAGVPMFFETCEVLMNTDIGLGGGIGGRIGRAGEETERGRLRGSEPARAGERQTVSWEDYYLSEIGTDVAVFDEDDTDEEEVDGGDDEAASDGEHGDLQ